jgi:hypothetical protein
MQHGGSPELMGDGYVNKYIHQSLMLMTGIEPVTPCLKDRRSTN